MSLLFLDKFQQLLTTKLPIYKFLSSSFVLLYAPGILIKIHPHMIKEVEEGIILNKHNQLSDLLLKKASEASISFQNMFKSGFVPTNITFYINQKCNLDCQYCFSLDGSINCEELSTESAMAGIELVAKNCCNQHNPMTIVIHGGGEPLLSRRKIDQIMLGANAILTKYGIRANKYIATNGVMPVEEAYWLGANFDRIGISCDGPFNIQSVQRPAKNKHDTNKIIERTARIIHEAGKVLDVRVTITPAVIESQTLIARYLCENLQANEIHVEPVYLGGKTNKEDCLDESHVEKFIQSFLEAQKIANHFNSRWLISGTRLNEVHTSYCHIFQQVLNLIPGEVATACFKMVNSKRAEVGGMMLGYYCKETDQFKLDIPHYEALLSQYAQPCKCEGCFIEYQCSHGCPNNCLLVHEFNDPSLCQVLQGIALAQIMQKAKNMHYGEIYYF
jgi:sulfatase maturation enzyme AslB (radical SAM superfamily)